MAVEKLTTRRVETVRVQQGSKLLELRDEEATGLELRVSLGGTKSWSFGYTHRSGGKRQGEGEKRRGMRRRVQIGTFPAMSLEAARKRAGELRRQVEAGGDPAGDKEIRGAAMTFRELAELRLASDNSTSDTTKAQYRQCYDADVYTAIGGIPANEVTAEKVARILDSVEGRGAAAMADRTRSAIGSVFKWALKRRHGGILADPTTGLGKRAPAAPRTRVLEDRELSALWHGMRSNDALLTEPMQLVVLIAMLTGQRRAEVCGARVSELRLEGAAPVWIIPGDAKRAGKVVKGRTKNRREQVVPLSRQVVDLWARAVQLANGHECAFPANVTQSKTKGRTRTPHLNPESVSQAMRRSRGPLAIDDARLHDLRRTMATWLGEQGVRPDVIDRVLNHAARDVTRRHYNFAGMDGLVRSAMQSWADHVWRVTGQTDTSPNVIALRA